MPFRVLVGDCLDSLRTLPDCSVHCCVTSPPYWGLRDYGHDGQIGLEASPEQFVAKLVEVFREVRRVLRDDGTCWVNLGSSYASSTSNESRSPLLARALACGSDDKVFRCSQDDDRAYPGSCGEHQDAIASRRAGIVRNGQCEPQAERPTLQTARDSERSDCVQEPADALPPDAQASTIRRSFGQPLAASCPSATGEASRQERRTLPPDASRSSDSSACTSGISQTMPPLAVRTVGKESFFSACGRSDCKGIGKCGLCWCSLSIPSLAFKPKDLVPIPWLVAMALQADGWWLRQDIIWHKPSPMPESVTDRCTKAHEYVFLLAKSERYYYDSDAVREPSEGTDPRLKRSPDQVSNGAMRNNNLEMLGTTRGKVNQPCCNPLGRNRRSVWTVATAPYSEAHFATYPPKLIEPCILAGTSEKGACSACGAPWERVVDDVDTGIAASGNKSKRWGQNHTTDRATGTGDVERHSSIPWNYKISNTIGWQPTCDCEFYRLRDDVPEPIKDELRKLGILEARDERQDVQAMRESV